MIYISHIICSLSGTCLQLAGLVWSFELDAESQKISFQYTFSMRASCMNVNLKLSNDTEVQIVQFYLFMCKIIFIKLNVWWLKLMKRMHCMRFFVRVFFRFGLIFFSSFPVVYAMCKHAPYMGSSFQAELMFLGYYTCHTMSWFIYLLFCLWCVCVANKFDLIFLVSFYLSSRLQWNKFSGVLGVFWYQHTDTVLLTALRLTKVSGPVGTS